MGSGKEEEKWKKEEEKIVQFSLIFFWIEIFVIIEKFCFLYSFFSIFYNVCNILDISLSKKANFWSKLYSYDYRGKWKKGRREERWKKEGEKVAQFSLIFFFFWIEIFVIQMWLQSFDSSLSSFSLSTMFVIF